MRTIIIFFVFSVFSVSLHAMDTSDNVVKVHVFGVDANREAEVDSLFTDYLLQNGLDDQKQALLKKHLNALPREDYFLLVSHLTCRGVLDSGNAADLRQKYKNDKLISVLFAIVLQLDKHNGFMEQQVAQLKEFNAGQEKDDNFAHEQFRFAKYSWKVGTLLGAIGTIIGSGIAIWQGTLAAEC
ncbi:MAG: hypothetical protein ACD_64C00150G0004 [uncultured bacterium]|nr:MAG: hypothetical protein ACD_64C00150G0004 [uncultured bacterium]